jgi:hypothetical protein
MFRTLFGPGLGLVGPGLGLGLGLVALGLGLDLGLVSSGLGLGLGPNLKKVQSKNEHIPPLVN